MRIVQLDSDGDMRIKIGENTWTFNPTCVMPLEDQNAAKKIPVLTKQETKDVSDDEEESSGDEEDQTRK